MPKTTTATFRQKKAGGDKITMLTAYDHATARICDEAGIDSLLVGDSLGMTILGYETTLPVTMEEMLHHTKAVTRGAENALVVADMPFMSYQSGTKQALENAGRFMKEALAEAVKLEGGLEVAPTVSKLVSCGIPVVGHIGLTPQSVHQLGGYKVQGRELDQARKLLNDAIALDEAGAFAIVLECVPAPLAALVSEKVGAATIGIGAGPGCDGQVQVISDILGLAGPKLPKHAKRYANLGAAMAEAIAGYATEVRESAFPGRENSFEIDGRVIEDLRGEL
ncbi:MAG: 3-methyl-2-oxobutanoate hydroxymethyltransferase [Actinobacteria bacterium]|nr:MAG: 3-methyl-2-oxobutanoate hydroxymethyltransferase [Actinomycetota bacterium]